MTEVVFVTGNKHKAEYFAKLMGLPIGHQKVELDELQSMDLHEIVEHKVRQAYEAVKKPVIVEDVSLEFNALGGLPGPFIKFFINHSGLEACCRMLDGLGDRSATLKCTFGFYDGKQLEMFDSALPGRISDHPMGENGFGFDPMFIQEGDDITFGQMSVADNQQVYRDKKKPFKQVRQFLEEYSND